jgi:hypothetical protein
MTSMACRGHSTSSFSKAAHGGFGRTRHEAINWHWSPVQTAIWIIVGSAPAGRVDIMCKAEDGVTGFMVFPTWATRYCPHSTHYRHAGSQEDLLPARDFATPEVQALSGLDRKGRPCPLAVMALVSSSVTSVCGYRLSPAHLTSSGSVGKRSWWCCGQGC